MSFQGTIALPDALDAVERNIRALIVLAGFRVDSVKVKADRLTGTASIVFNRRGSYISCTVNFPVMPSSHRVTKDELDRWTGYTLHEVSHALYTDNDAWQMSIGEGLSSLVNGLEDVRIERLLHKAAIASNSFELLTDLMRWAVAEAGPNQDPNQRNSLPWTLASLGRRIVAGYDLPQLDAVIARATPSTKAMLDHVFVKLRKAQSTLDVLKIARELCGRDPETGAKPQPKPQQPQPQPQPQPPQGDQGDQGDQGESDQGDHGQEAEQGSGSGSQAVPDDAPGEKGESEGKPQPVESKSTETGDAAGDGAQGAPKNGDPFGLKDEQRPDQWMEKVDLDPLSKESHEASNGLLRNSVDTARLEGWLTELIRDANRRAGAGMRPFDKGSPMSGERIRAAAQRCGTLRQHVARVIKAVETETWDRNRSAGRLDRFALARIGAGQTENVYAKRTISEGFETEVVVVCDGSSSMASDDKLSMVATMALVIAQACQQQGVACEVVQFNPNGVNLVKGVKDRASSSLSSFGRLSVTSGGCTPLSQTLVTMAARLVKRAPLKRKILFAVTDGECDSGPEMVRKVCDHAERMGVETIGLSIDSRTTGAFRYEARCSSRDDVAKAGLGVLVRALEGRAPR